MYDVSLVFEGFTSSSMQASREMPFLLVTPHDWLHVLLMSVALKIYLVIPSVDLKLS